MTDAKDQVLALELTATVIAIGVSRTFWVQYQLPDGMWSMVTPFVDTEARAWEAALSVLQAKLWKGALDL